MRTFEPRNPDYRKAVEEIFSSAPFVLDLGARLEGVGAGWCETCLPLSSKHHQQHGYVHAGVVASLADHTAGGAATSLVEAGAFVLTIEFKINFLETGRGQALRCRAQVLRAGSSIHVVESDVYANGGPEQPQVGKALVTLAVRR